MLQERFPCEVFLEFGEKVSAEDTAFYFSNAKIVLGPHGAGLSNLVFTQPLNQNDSVDLQSRAVIEFMVADTHQLLGYSRLSLAMGWKFFGLMFYDVGQISPFGFTADVETVTETVFCALNGMDLKTSGQYLNSSEFKSVNAEWCSREPFADVIE